MYRLPDRYRSGREGPRRIHRITPRFINLTVLSRSSLLEKNRKGVTAYQAAETRRGRQRYSSSVDDYLTAVCDRSLVTVKTHLCQDVSVQDMDSEGHTGLLAACRVGRSDIADLLIHLDADIHVVDLHGLLHFTGHGNTMCLAMYDSWSSIGQISTQKARDGHAALRFACQISSHTLSADLTRLLDAGAYAQDDSSIIPQHEAARQGHTDTARLLTGAERTYRNVSNWATQPYTQS